MSTEQDLAADHTAEPWADEPDGGDRADRADRSRRPLLIAAIVLLVVALGAAGWFGYSWFSAATDTDNTYATARDDVLRVGEQMAVNFTSLDYQHLDVLKQRLEESSTGSLHDQIGKAIDQYRNQLDQNRLIAHSELVDGAVTALDLHANSATVLALVRSTKQPADPKAKPAQPQQLPIVIDLTRTDAGAPWKAESISGAPTVGNGQ